MWYDVALVLLLKERFIFEVTKLQDLALSLRGMSGDFQWRATIALRRNVNVVGWQWAVLQRCWKQALVG